MKIMVWKSLEKSRLDFVHKNVYEPSYTVLLIEVILFNEE